MSHKRTNKAALVLLLLLLLLSLSLSLSPLLLLLRFFPSTRATGAKRTSEHSPAHHSCQPASPTRPLCVAEAAAHKKCAPRFTRITCHRPESCRPHTIIHFSFGETAAASGAARAAGCRLPTPNSNKPTDQQTDRTVVWFVVKRRPEVTCLLLLIHPQLEPANACHN